MLCEPNGYVHNATIACSDPLKFDNLRGRIISVVYNLLTSGNIERGGKSFIDEGRVVRNIPF